MTFMTRATAVLLAVLVTGALVALSQVPFAVDTLDEGALRLSWRVRSVTRETCRELTAEEFANTPAHMRQAQVCENEAIAYVLHVVVDGDTLLAKTFEPSGRRADRPLHVYEEIRLQPGNHVVDIRFATDQRFPTDADRSFPESLVFTRELQLRDRQIVLVTYDESARQLLVR